MSKEYTYFRKYIILKKDYTNISDINPKGHAKIEVRGNKGNVSLNVDNCEKENYYRVYLLMEINGKIEEEDIGRIFADDKGRIRTNIGLNLKELEAKGFSIDKIDAILIRRGISLLLGGYIDKDNKVIDRFIEKMASEEGENSFHAEKIIEAINEEEQIAMEVAVEEGEKERIKEEILEKLIVEDIVEENVQEEPVKDEISGDDETVNDVAEEMKEEIGEKINEEGIQDIVMEDEWVIDNVSESFKDLEYARRLHYKNQMTNYILSVLRFFPQVQPLKIYLHNYTWWRIEDDGSQPYRGFLPYYNYLMSSDYKYPFLQNAATCMDQIKRYGHYLFGLYKENDEVKLYIYGVPGRFTLEEHPFRGITGFNTWYDSVDGIGYWVLYIDPIKGKVIYPINPMVPSY